MKKRLRYSRIYREHISSHTAYYRFAPITAEWKYACICSRSWTYLARNLFGVSCFPSFTKATRFSRDSFHRTFQIECVKKCSEFIWRANLQMCFLFSKMWHSDTFFLSYAGQNLITYPELHLNLSLWVCRCMSHLSLCCFQFGHLDKNTKTFLDIVKYHQFSGLCILSCLFCFQFKVVFEHNLNLSCLAFSFYDTQIIPELSPTQSKTKLSYFGVLLFVTAQSVLTFNKMSTLLSWQPKYLDKTQNYIDTILIQEKFTSMVFPFFWKVATQF